MTRKVIVLACVLALIGLGAWAGGTAETKKALPPGPAFDSATAPADEGTRIRIRRNQPKPIKIAVLGLENNPLYKYWSRKAP